MRWQQLLLVRPRLQASVEPLLLRKPARRLVYQLYRDRPHRVLVRRVPARVDEVAPREVVVEAVEVVALQRLQPRPLHGGRTVNPSWVPSQDSQQAAGIAAVVPLFLRET